MSGEARTSAGISLGRVANPLPEPPTLVLHHPSPEQRATLLAVVERAAAAGDPLDDLLAADLAHGGDVVAVLAGDPADPEAYAQASVSHGGMVVGVVSATGEATRHALHRTALQALLRAVPAQTAVTWWPTLEDESLAAPLGLVPHRRLLRMEVPLPLPVATDLVTRPYRVGADDAAWLEVNNAAFHWHGEQGGWDLAGLRQRQREPWFDAAAFLLHERDGRLAGFCWTKAHPGAIGEVYVVAVHPAFHGLGLGRALTIAGYAHQAAAGATTGMLYVDATNSPAVRMYEALGMRVVAARQSYHRAPGAPA